MKYVGSQEEGRGQGKSVHLLFLCRHSIVKKRTRGGGGVIQKPNLSIRTLWMVPFKVTIKTLE